MSTDHSGLPPGKPTGLASALIQFYEAMGVDQFVNDEPIDWLSRGKQGPGALFQSPARNASPASQPNSDAPAARQPKALNTAPATKTPKSTSSALPAAGASVAANSLADISTQLAAFEGCTLKKTARNLCVFRGSERARIAVIGEAPGREEDAQGRPFVGRAGQLLDRMLASIGLNETNTHITNIVYWRPPGNRAPTQQEASACRPFLERQIELVDPDIVLLMGGSAAKHILETKDGIMRIRGRMRQVELGGRQRDALATLHPAYLLRTGSAKHLSWKDLLTVKQYLQ